MIRIKPLPMCPYRLKPHDKLYFLHVYKTAGTTFRMLLEDRFDRHEICPAHQIGELLRLPADRLVRYRLFWGHLGFKLADLMPEEMIYLTLLRDPIEHVLSIYHAVRREPAHILYDKVNRLGLSLDAFLRDEDAVTHVRNQQVFTLAWWHLIQDRLPETVALRREADRSFRSAPDDVLAELVLERLERFAFVGLTERMVDATRLLTYTLGWEPFDDVPRLNAAPERIRKDELAPATLEAIQDLTRQDARLYAHAGRLFEARFQRMLQAEQLAERAGCEAEGPSPLSREGRALRGADREETGPFWARVADDLRELSETRASLAEVRAELAASRRVYAELEAGAAAARRAYAELEAGAAAAHQIQVRVHDEMTALRRAYDDMRFQFAAASKYNRHIEDRLVEAHQQIGQAQVRLEQSEHACAGLAKELGRARDRLTARLLRRLARACSWLTWMLKSLVRRKAA